jgi:hypothetical protein
LVISLLTITVFPQISPGDLTTAHSKLEGMSNCTKCHELGEQVSKDKCLDCHKEIKSLINAGRGYHSSSESKSKDCWACHSEHNGRNFRIINFNAKSFNHDKAGYTLTGKHAKTKCEDCHKTEFISDKELKKRKGTYLGLNDDCESCHEDYHQKSLGNKCENCHNTEAFRPAPKFDHQKARFTLTGKHQDVDCIKCHKKETLNGKEFQRFKDIAFSNCNSCHKDVHNGKFGPDCQSCHQTSSFNTIKGNSFDHSKTDFPLIGKHKVVKCNDCHKTNLKQNMPHELCTDCHKDYHSGQFMTVDIKVQNCADCHNEQGFTPSTFTLERHAKTKFQLTGGHLAVPCKSCHYKTTTLSTEKVDWHFKNLSLDCISCHENVHGSELTIEFLPNNNCSFCHSTENWSLIEYDHNKTKFPLQGKHQQVTCRKCHYNEEKIEQNKYVFVSMVNECETCHKDIHYGQFEENNISKCENCHGFDDWKAGKFDHNKTNFSLEGAHSKVECVRCHPVVQENELIYQKFKLEDFKCAFCHK